jgi:hypothetical protein
MAVLNLMRATGLPETSSLTIGTVYCSSFIEKGSKPATKAEVSRTTTFLPEAVVRFYLPLHGR